MFSSFLHAFLFTVVINSDFLFYLLQTYWQLKPIWSFSLTELSFTQYFVCLQFSRKSAVYEKSPCLVLTSTPCLNRIDHTFFILMFDMNIALYLNLHEVLHYAAYHPDWMIR